MKPLALIACLLAGPATAHEFWIAPQAHDVPAGGELVADLRVGEKFEGSAFSYVPPNFTRFEVLMGGTATGVPGRAGDRPALRMAAPGEGLAIVVHQTREYALTYDDWAKFVRFAEHKGFPQVIDRHLARGLPREAVKERYTRFAKSLIAVGDGAGADREVGLLTEIVAEANPYADDLSGGLPVRVLYEGAPRVDAQVELFDRAPDGSVSVTTARTDAEGRAILAVAPGHSYLADAVVMLESEPTARNPAAWQSLWASLTFAVPD